MSNKRVIAFDVGGTSIRCSTVENDKILEYFKVPTPKTKKEFLERIDELIEKFNSPKIKGIGMGIAGVIENGIVKNAPNLGLKNFDMKAHLEKKSGKKVFISNDVNCFALAESVLGVQNKNFLLVAFGTGIGGGIVINGKTYRGNSGYGGEFGHMYFNNEQWETTWKRHRNDIKKEFGDNILFKELVGNKSVKAKKILDEVTETIGIGIASLISSFDPEVVVVGGGIREAGIPFLNMLNKKVKKYSFLPKITPVVWTALEHPGTMGASLLVKEKTK